jgi:MoaA/NifB/PqqE/SkfB family radical SAM enzyme
MRFPLRLTADIGFTVALRSLGFRSNRRVIEILTPDGNLKTRSPIVWIGGAEPLDVQGTPRTVNSLAAAGRHVFLPTTGILLRRRIHEFQPSPRLHLTIRFDGAELAHDGRVGHQGAFRDALESVRTARLSGFLLCAQLVLHAPSESAEIERLQGELRDLDLDGFVISPASPVSEELRSSVAAMRRRLLSRRWALLSSLLDSVVAPSFAQTTATQIAPRHSRAISAPLPSRSREESVQAP